MLESYHVGKCMAFMQLDIRSGDVLGGNPAPPDCASLLVQVQGQDIRVRMDGQPADLHTGHVITAGTSVLLQLPSTGFPQAYFAVANEDGIATLACHFFAAPA